MMISYIGISKKAVKISREEAAKDHPLWRAISNFAHPMVAPISVVVAVVALAGGVWYGQNLEDRRPRPGRAGTASGFARQPGQRLRHPQLLDQLPTCW